MQTWDVCDRASLLQTDLLIFYYVARRATTKQPLLQVLVFAITDIGCWRWWEHQLPDGIQLEFGGVQVYIPPEDKTRAPSSVLAIRLVRPSRVYFLTRKGASLPSDWPELIRKDQLDAFSFSYEDPFLLGASVPIEKVLADPDSIIEQFRSESNSSEITLAFWAGSAGVCIEAESIRLFLMSGEISLPQAAELHQAWWRYWKDYWKKQDTDEAYPYDSLCEITIPAGE